MNCFSIQSCETLTSYFCSSTFLQVPRHRRIVQSAIIYIIGYYLYCRLCLHFDLKLRCLVTRISPLPPPPHVCVIVVGSVFFVFTKTTRVFVSPGTKNSATYAHNGNGVFTKYYPHRDTTTTTVMMSLCRATEFFLLCLDGHARARLFPVKLAHRFFALLQRPNRTSVSIVVVLRVIYVYIYI